MLVGLSQKGEKNTIERERYFGQWKLLVRKV